MQDDTSKTRTYYGEERSVGELISELSSDLSSLVNHEVQLAKLEMSKMMSVAMKNALSIAIGGAIAYAGLLAVMAMAILLLAFAMPFWVASLIVGAVMLIIGGAMLIKGIHTFKEMNFVPEQTVETIKEDKRWLKNQTS